MNPRQSEPHPSHGRHALGLALVILPWVVLGFLMSQ
jgi:hypothetical protein